MASNTYKTIYLKGWHTVRLEYQAMEAITPGHVVQLHTDGKLKKHATAAGSGATWFASENDVPVDDYSGNAIDHAYAATDRVQVIDAKTGDVINALLAPSATAVVVGNPVESAGDGTVRLHTAPANLSAAGPKYDSIMGYAQESVDNSANAATAVRIAIVIA